MNTILLFITFIAIISLIISIRFLVSKEDRDILYIIVSVICFALLLLISDFIN